MATTQASNLLRLVFWKTLDFVSHYDECPVRTTNNPEQTVGWPQFLQPPTEILPNLFLGSSYNAAMVFDAVVLNVTEEVPEFANNNLKFYRLGVRDVRGAILFDSIDTALMTMLCLRTRKKCLVHCFSGRSRSVSVVVLYLCLYYPYQFQTIETAIEYVAKKRTIAINTDFVSQIKEWLPLLRAAETGEERIEAP